MRDIKEHKRQQNRSPLQILSIEPFQRLVRSPFVKLEIPFRVPIVRLFRLPKIQDLGRHYVNSHSACVSCALRKILFVLFELSQ